MTIRVFERFSFMFNIIPINALPLSRITSATGRSANLNSLSPTIGISNKENCTYLRPVLLLGLLLKQGGVFVVTKEPLNQNSPGRLPFSHWPS